MSAHEKYIDDLMHKLSTKQAEILDNFAEAYLAETRLRPSEVEMVAYMDRTDRSGEIRHVWFFRKRDHDRITDNRDPVTESPGISPLVEGKPSSSAEKQLDYVNRLRHVQYETYLRETEKLKAELAHSQKWAESLYRETQRPIWTAIKYAVIRRLRCWGFIETDYR